MERPDVTEMRKQAHQTNAEPDGLSSDPAQSVSISMDENQKVSGLLQLASNNEACYVLAHGAGAGMRHAFLEDMSRLFGARGISSLRYQFPYMERGSGRPDSPKVAQATVRAAVTEAARLLPNLALFAGGKSFGGRMTSQAQAEAPLPGVRGLIFLGFPLHPPGRPSEDRASHLFQIQIPMLFLQGDRDEFAELSLLRQVTKRLGALATLSLVEGADHSFHVPARTGLRDSDVRDQLSVRVRDWVQGVLS